MRPHNALKGRPDVDCFCLVFSTASWWTVSVRDSLLTDNDEEQTCRMVLSRFDSSRCLHQLAQCTSPAWLPGLLVVLVARFSSVLWSGIVMYDQGAH